MLEENYHVILKLLLAALIALPVAWHRERHSRIVGLRTFPLVSLGACAYLLIGLEAFGVDSEANARLLQGLLTGIGFVGGGAILKHENHVTGTASAASIWVTGAIGASVAYGFWVYAVVISLTNFLLVAVLTPLKAEEDRDLQNK